MSVAKLTGKAGSFTLNTHVLSFTVMNSKVNRELADTTDSANYDSTTDLVWPAQIPVSEAIELSVEGNFDLNSTDAQLIALLMAGGAAVPVIINLSASVVLGHGNFDL